MSVAPLPPTRESPRLSRRRRWWFAGIALSLGLFAGFAIAELLLRLFGWDYRSPYDFDAQCGVRLRPGFQFPQTSEGRARILINSAGCRDVEHDVRKPDDVLRIAVLGDSFAEAVQVELEQTFWSVMAKDLNDCRAMNGRWIEVLNFGVSGYGTTRELQALRNHVWRYQPDVILLAFLPGNDVRNNSRDLEPVRGRPFYRRVGGRYELDLSLATDDGQPPCTAFVERDEMFPLLGFFVPIGWARLRKVSEPLREFLRVVPLVSPCGPVGGATEPQSSRRFNDGTNRDTVLGQILTARC